MSSKKKLRAKLDNFASDKNWTLAEAELILTQNGFTARPGPGSHTNYWHPLLTDIVTLAAHGKSIKPSYVRQIREALQLLPQ